MSNLTKKVKKKKSRQTKIKFLMLVTVAVALSFLNAASAFFLRKLYNTSTLLPSFGIAKSGVMFSFGDLTVLKHEMAFKILGDKDLLYAEQAREFAILALIFVLAYIIGKTWLERVSILLFIGGLFGALYYAFIYAFLKWPTSLVSRDIIALLPTPVIVPIYMPILLSALVFVGGFFLVFKKK